MRIGRIREAIFGFALISLASLALLYVGVPTYAKMWHVLQGDVVQCGDFRIPVPNRWWAKPLKDGGYELITFSLAYALKDRTTVTISFHPVTFAPSVDDNGGKMLSTGYSGMAERFRRSVDLIMDKRSPVVCFEADKPVLPPSSEILCSVDKRMIISFVHGDQQSEPQFYEVMRRIVVRPEAVPQAAPPEVSAELGGDLIRFSVANHPDDAIDIFPYSLGCCSPLTTHLYSASNP